MSQFLGSGWEQFLDSIQDTCTPQVQTDVGLEVFFIELNKLMEKKSNLGWHVRFFEDGINPQGLRIQIFPSFAVTDVTFKEKWEKT